MKIQYETGRPLNVSLPVRRIVQLLFLIITLYMGIKFYWFAAQIEAGAGPGAERPPGVEAFLPISALVSLKYLIFTGIFNKVHPSALVIFLIICTTALLFKKAFCSWICPVGFLSDLLAKLHFYMFKQRYRLPKWPDLVLRGIKYALALFFIWNIFINMPVTAAGRFIQSPYNRFADIKMLEFFTRISPTAAGVLAVLLALSLFIPHFWCRYLCPYGGLLGVLGFFSLGKIRRNHTRCTDCKKCQTVCPGQIRITSTAAVNSLECSACLRCLDACPQKDALEFSLTRTLPMPPARIALALVLLFAGGIITAKQTGYWQNNTSNQAYRRYFITRQMPKTMPRAMPGAINPEKLKRMMEMMEKTVPAS